MLHLSTEEWDKEVPFLPDGQLPEIKDVCLVAIVVQEGEDEWYARFFLLTFN